MSRLSSSSPPPLAHYGSVVIAAATDGHARQECGLKLATSGSPRPRRPADGPLSRGAQRDERPRQADPPRRSEERLAPVRQLFNGSDRPDSDSLQRRRSRARSSDSASTPNVAQVADSGACSHYLSGAVGSGCSCFPRCWWGPRVDPGCDGGRRISPRAVGGAQRRRRFSGSKWGSPRAGLVDPPGEEVPGALQDVSSRPRSLHRKLFDLSCSLTLILSSRRHADIGVLSLAPLKLLALSARVMPSEPRPQPPCVESLLV
jgi:hypothetical protein